MLFGIECEHLFWGRKIVIHKHFFVSVETGEYNVERGSLTTEYSFYGLKTIC
jgi:hypothetical protein